MTSCLFRFPFQKCVYFKTLQKQAYSYILKILHQKKKKKKNENV